MDAKKTLTSLNRYAYCLIHHWRSIWFELMTLFYCHIFLLSHISIVTCFCCHIFLARQLCAETVTTFWSRCLKAYSVIEKCNNRLNRHTLLAEFDTTCHSFKKFNVSHIPYMLKNTDLFKSICILSYSSLKVDVIWASVSFLLSHISSQTILGRISKNILMAVFKSLFGNWKT